MLARGSRQGRFLDELETQEDLREKAENTSLKIGPGVRIILSACHMQVHKLKLDHLFLYLGKFTRRKQELSQLLEKSIGAGSGQVLM